MSSVVGDIYLVEIGLSPNQLQLFLKSYVKVFFCDASQTLGFGQGMADVHPTQDL
jgi:hypothetical protein